MTCGQGLAEHAALPRALRDVASSMAGVLEHHITSLEAGSDPERAAYLTLVNDYRALASTLDTIADRMASYHDLPQAEHNVAALTSPEAVQKFAAFVESERALRDLLERWVGRDEGMLAEMGG